MPVCWSAQDNSTHKSFAVTGHANNAELRVPHCIQIYTCEAY